MNVLEFAAASIRFSPVRTLEYEELKKITLHGKVLDLGGGSVSTYLRLCKGKYKAVSINISPETKPTIIGDITKPFKLKDKEFDFVVSMNTFEHIPEFETTFSETFRVLKKNGTFIFSTPFLHQIHGSPDDYWRYSASALERLLKKNGFTVNNIKPLGTGMFMARYSLIYGALPRIIRPLAASWAYFADKSMTALSNRYKKACTDNYPIGYFVYAKKA